MEWTTYVAEKKWRNSVFLGNSSGRFLHGPPLKSGSNEFAALPLKWIPSKGVQVLCLSFYRLQIQLWLQIACYVTSLASTVKQYTHVRRFRVVLIKSNTPRCLKKNSSFVSNSVRCSRFGNIPFRLVSLLFAAVARWKRRANWLMMAALFTTAANLSMTWSNMTWSQTLQASSFFHQNFLALNKILNLFTGGRIMQFLAIN